MKKVVNILENKNYQIHTSQQTKDNLISSIYVSDLLSRVIKNGAIDGCLITIMNHLNTVATATMVDMSCIVICEKQNPTELMIQKAESFGIALISTSLKSYEVAIDFFQRGFI